MMAEDQDRQRRARYGRRGVGFSAASRKEALRTMLEKPIREGRRCAQVLSDAADTLLDMQN